MTQAIYFKQHRSWEDWLGIGLGAALIISPWLFGHAAGPVVTITAFGIGLLVAVLATMEFLDRQIWEETLEIAAGLAMLAMPFVYAYAGSTLGMLHLAIGAIITSLAVLELWQEHSPQRQS